MPIGNPVERKGGIEMKPFRFGVSIWHAQSRAEFVEKARKIEALGYDTLTLPDHLTDRIAPMPALISAAEATKHLRVGTNVLNNDLRHPVLVAREAAAVDLLTDGRFQLGLGAGSIQSEYEQAGLTFDTGARRVARLAEAVTVIKGLLKGEQVTFAGRYYRVTGHTIAPLPVQKPHPPILVGGNGERLLALAAREADIVGLAGMTFRHGGAVPPDLSGWRVSGVDDRVRRIREIAGDERYARLELNALVQQVVVTDDRRNTAEELSRRWVQLDADEILQSPYVLIGTADQMVADLQTRRQRWGISYYVIHEPYVDTFAPVVARLVGK
ncbi:MAG TPA: LLM class F420-dependent oxidoreductase [Rhodopila sp.]|jgi:probable F420-dependent oxidoreductase